MSVTIAEKLREWISTYPQWDMCSANLCMLPKEQKELSVRRDVLGNLGVVYRCYVTLHWELPALDSPEEDTHRLLRFIQWVQHQIGTGCAPRLGDDPTKEHICTEKAGQTLGGQTVIYTVTLVADYMKVYKEK